MAKDPKGDNRLKKMFTIEQFRVAFGKYRRVMVTKWPHRQYELAAYETDIARIHAFYDDRPLHMEDDLQGNSPEGQIIRPPVHRSS